MLAIIYLLLGSFLGWTLLSLLRRSSMENPLLEQHNKAVIITRCSVWIAGSFFSGILVLTWATYLSSYLFRHTDAPLRWGNMLGMTITALLLIVTHVQYKRKQTQNIKLSHVQDTQSQSNPRQQTLFDIFRDFLPEILLALGLLGISSSLMFLSFSQKGESIHIGYSVFGDVGPHLAMIRSFSLGLNFPAQYPFFAEEGIRYHFLFQFLCGNLEFLGLRIDWAFNLPSIVSYVFSLLLLHALATRLTGHRSTGILTIAFFMFRSSFGFFKEFHLSATAGISFRDFIVNYLNQVTFTDLSTHDDWGMWNQNVFINQRHLMFSVGILLLILYLMLPRFEEMTAAMQKSLLTSGTLSTKKSSKTAVILYQRCLNGFKAFAFNKEAWLPENLLTPLFCGLLLGGIGFWNGAVVIAAMPILFFIAVASRRRLEFLFLVLIAGGLVLLQSSFLSGTGAGIVSPKITTWFLAEQHTWPGLLDYLVRLLGIMPLLLLLSLTVHAMKRNGWIIIAFSAPFMMAFILQLTPDIAVNHKYITLSVMLLNISIADFIVQLWKEHRVRLVAATLVIFMTISGVFDLVILFNRNRPRPGTGITSFVQDQSDPFYLFIRDQTPKDAVFLTDTLFIHPVLTAGRRLFYGWTYYSWSAGYDTTAREQLVKEIFSAPDGTALQKMVNQHGIDYILIDDGLRNGEKYPVNERVISSVFPIVYQNSNGSETLYVVE